MILKRKALGAQEAYVQRIDASGAFRNPMKDALPQTVVAEAVRRHMDRSGRRKKALIIGFDGARADSIISLLNPGSAIYAPAYSGMRKLCDQGGAVLTYAGGAPGHEQQTLTQQGWASILTGEWADVHGVVNFDVLTGAETVLMEYARKGKQTAFFGIWPHHFEVTYSKEMETARRENLPCRYVPCKEDRELTARMIEAVQSDVDVAIGILEAPDNAGHQTKLGFWDRNPQYMSALFSCDHCAYDIISAIEERPSFPEEDWLILITSDHGGHLRSHGSQDIRDRTTFVVSNHLSYF